MKRFKKSVSKTPKSGTLLAIKKALNSADIGHWTWEPCGQMQWDTCTARLIGSSELKANHSVTDFLIHISDENNTHLTLLNALESCSLNDEALDLHVTICKENTEVRRVRIIGYANPTEGSKEVSVTGICIEDHTSISTAKSLQPSSLDDFFNRSQDLMAELDFNGTFIHANDAWCRYLGIKLSELIGKPLLDLLHPDNLPNTRLWLRQLTQKQTQDQHTSSHGELSARIHIPRKGNREISWTWTADMKAQRIFTITRDSTETYQEETELTQELAQAQRSNSELESFASTASHDLREPLRMITSYLKLLQKRYPEALDSRGRRYVDYASEGANRMRTLIDDLLAYSRIGKASNPHEPVALDDVIAHAIDNLSVSIRKTDAEITVDINDAPVVWGDSTRLTRLFQNLLGNAIKFQAEGQTPVVKVSFQDGALKGTPEKCIVTIEDNGIGIDPDHKDILFNLFQRLNTRDEYEGSGIGLSVCKKIAEQHNGQIWFYSIPQQGSTFHVSINKTKSEAL